MTRSRQRPQPRSRSRMGEHRGGGHRALLSTVVSLVAATGVTSVLGVAFWWLAAHRASLAAVGNGSAAVFFSRMLPLVRTFVSVPAGVAKMPLARFSLLTVLGSIPWVLALALVGQGVGQNWESWRHHLSYLDYLIAAAIVISAIWWLLRRRSAGDGPQPA